MFDVRQMSDRFSDIDKEWAYVGNKLTVLSTQHLDKISYVCQSNENQS